MNGLWSISNNSLPFSLITLRYQSMTEREKTDFNRGDTNNEHFFKRGLGTAVTEQAHKRLRTDNQPGLNKQTGRGEKRA